MFDPGPICANLSSKLLHRMPLLPSILLSILLLAKLASSAASTPDGTLAPYFEMRAVGSENIVDNMLLKPYAKYWPSGRLTAKALRKGLEAGETEKVGNLLKQLRGELAGVLCVVLYPACTPAMSKTLLKMATTFDPMQTGIVYKYILINQPWSEARTTLSTLSAYNNSVFKVPACLLVWEAFKLGKFNLIGRIIGAFEEKPLRESLKHILAITIPGGKFNALAEIFIKHDTGKKLAPAVFKILKTKKDPTANDFAKLFKHPTVDSQQFARIINEVTRKQGPGTKHGEYPSQLH